MAGLNFNWGALLGYAAVKGALGWPALLLYAGGIAWTLGYDTIYAHQDKEDDALIGVKSSALALGNKTRPWLFIFYAAAIVLWAAAGAWQAHQVVLDDSADCLAKFKSNRLTGWLLLAGIVAAHGL